MRYYDSQVQASAFYMILACLIYFVYKAFIFLFVFFACAFVLKLIVDSFKKSRELKTDNVEIRKLIFDGELDYVFQKETILDKRKHG